MKKLLLLLALIFLAPAFAIAQPSPTDGDGDGIVDGSDNCPAVWNPSQGDANTNGVGDACEPETTSDTTEDTVDPIVTDDSDSGHQIGSRWINTTLDTEFVALDVTVGAAVWKETTGASSGVTETQLKTTARTFTSIQTFDESIVTGRLGQSSTATTGGAIRIVDGAMFPMTVAGVQAALDELETVGAGTVIVPATANISITNTSIKIPNRVLLKGLGYGGSTPTFVADNAANVTAMIENKDQDGTQQFCMIEGIQLSANKGGGAVIGAGIKFANGCFAGSFIRDTLVTNTSGSGIVLDGGATLGVGVVILSNVIVTNSGSHNIYAKGCSNDGHRFFNIDAEGAAAGMAQIYITRTGCTSGVSSNHRLVGIHMEGSGLAADGIVLDGTSGVMINGVHWDGDSTQLNVVKILGSVTGSDGAFAASGHVLRNVMGNLTTIIDDQVAGVTVGSAQGRFVPFYVSPVASGIVGGTSVDVAQMAGIQVARKGVAIASAATISPEDGNLFEVTGTTDITTITADSMYSGKTIVLQFTNAAPPDIIHGNNIELNGAANFSPAQNDAVSLVCDGTNWIQIGGGGGGITNVVEDLSPVLGADLEAAGLNIQSLGVLTMVEQADADADVAGEGQLWVNTATPNELWFTDDTGTDVQLGLSGSFDATAIDAVTWSDGVNASNAWTFNVSGTDPVVTWGNGTVDFSTSVTATDFTADPSATPNLLLVDSHANAGEGRVLVDGDLTDALMDLQVDVAGTLTSFIQLDGVNETVDMLKPTTLQALDIAAGEYAADSIDADDLNDILTFEDGSLLDFGTNISSATEGILLPAHLTSCASATAEGQVCWEEDAKILWVGDGAAPIAINASGGTHPIAAGDYAADSVDADDLNDTLTFEDGTLLDFGTLISDATEGIFLPAHATTCAAATAEGQICWEEDAKNLWIGDGAAAIQMNGAAPATEIRSHYWPAGAMEVDGAQCTAPAAVALVTGGPTPLVIKCKDNDAGTIAGTPVSMPDGWDAGTVTFTLILGQIAASTGAYEMDFEAQCIGNDEPFLAWAGTGEQPAAITLTADDDMLEDDTGAVTLNGTTCAAGDVIAWRGAIDATASATAIETLAVIVGVKMEYTTEIGD